MRDPITHEIVAKLYDSDDVPDPHPAIDWEAKFHQQVSDSIRHKASVSAKLAEAQLELDQARTEIQKLKRKVQRITPAADQLKAAQAGRTESDRIWGERARELKAEINELKAENKKLLDAQHRGRRAVLEAVVTWLQRNIEAMPEPFPVDRIELAP